MQQVQLTADGSDFYARGLASLLQPIAELAFYFGLQPHEFRRSLNQASVRAISARVRSEEGREPTAARLSLFCGLTIAESQQLLEDEKKALMLEKLATQVMTTLTRWHTDSRFSSLYGVPYELQLSPQHHPNFSELVAACEFTESEDDILFELKSSGCVEQIGESKVRATNRTYKLPRNTNSQVARLFEIVRNFNDTWVQNIVRVSKGEPSFLEIDVHTDAPISASSFASVAKIAGEKLVSIVHEVDSLMNQSNGVPDPLGVMGGIGVYVYADRATMSQQNIKALSKVTPRVGL
jgi:hypothetical protein